jgi:glycosyltransferase involved in cell wall biosynthesis
MKRACLRGVVDGFSSYSLHLFRVAEGLAKLGRYTTIYPVSAEFGRGPIPKLIRDSLVNQPQLEDWQMIIHCPSFSPRGDKRTVYNTMWETSRLNKDGVINLNNSDLVVVPSAFNQICFNAQGVKRPMVKVPMGIDTEMYRYTPPVKKDVYIFGTAGRTFAGGCRKGLPEVVDAWKKAFPKSRKDVRLLVKCHPDDPDIDIDDPRIKFKKEFWTRKQLADWYANIDCFVSASKGEGWGLHQHEAMATGRSVIAVNYGGITEFFDEGVGYPVDYDLQESDGHYDNRGLWAIARQASLVDRMREVYSNRRSDRELKASERGMKLNWDHSNQILDKVLQKAGFYH